MPVIWQCTRVSATLEQPTRARYCWRQGQKLSCRDRVVSLGFRVVVTPGHYEDGQPVCRSFVPGTQEKKPGGFLYLFSIANQNLFLYSGPKTAYVLLGPGKINGYQKGF